MSCLRASSPPALCDFFCARRGPRVTRRGPLCLAAYPVCDFSCAKRGPRVTCRGPRVAPPALCDFFCARRGPRVTRRGPLCLAAYPVCDFSGARRGPRGYRTWVACLLDLCDVAASFLVRCCPSVTGRLPVSPSPASRLHYFLFRVLFGVGG